MCYPRLSYLQIQEPLSPSLSLGLGSRLVESSKAGELHNAHGLVFCSVHLTPAQLGSQGCLSGALVPSSGPCTSFQLYKLEGHIQVGNYTSQFLSLLPRQILQQLMVTPAVLSAASKSPRGLCSVDDQPRRTTADRSLGLPLWILTGLCKARKCSEVPPVI